MKEIHGPMGFTDMDHEGMLIEGFDQLGTMAAIYNFPYYPQHLERMGYEKIRIGMNLKYIFRKVYPTNTCASEK